MMNRSSGRFDPTVSRERLVEIVAELRPDLHRYCARMTGSVVEGEDVVQETLVRALASLAELERSSQVRAWLFRIAHNRAIDHLKVYERRMSEPLEAIAGHEEERDDRETADDLLARDEAVRVAIARFLDLPPLQRSCVILKDVLDHSVDEIAALLEISVSAAQAGLHRGRMQLRRPHEEREAREPARQRQSSPVLARYAALFEMRDWDAVRAMLADDVRLDVVSRLQRSGRRDVGGYFSNYATLAGWRVALGWLEGREVMAVFQGERLTPSYFIEVVVCGDRVTSIRDFRHVPYVARDAEIISSSDAHDSGGFDRHLIEGESNAHRIH
jgi:RNA polymerase sigma factor (sigma-70 family)